MQTKNFRFNLQETAGAIGDYGTILPIVMGVAAVTEVNLSVIFLFFGISYICTGFYYQLPIPVEPMKAIGVMAIGGSLTAHEIYGAGIMMGILLLVISITGMINKIRGWVPLPIVRGIQLGLALTLLKEAVRFISFDWQVGLLSVVIILIFTSKYLRDRDISALLVVIIGLIIGIYRYGSPELKLFTIPELIIPSFHALSSGFINGAIPQLPLTIGNAALATSLLVHDLFNRRVDEAKLIKSMGVMCLLSSPLGGFPMCHGAGGLAAQYRFGARTGGSNIISGVILLILALLFASPELITIIPFGSLGALLFFSSIELGKNSFKTEGIVICVLTGIIAFFLNITIAFVVMMGYYYIDKHYLKLFS